jgi:hypothetical protein
MTFLVSCDQLEVAVYGLYPTEQTILVIVSSFSYKFVENLTDCGHGCVSPCYFSGGGSSCSLLGIAIGDLQ